MGHMMASPGVGQCLGIVRRGSMCLPVSPTISSIFFYVSLNPCLCLCVCPAPRPHTSILEIHSTAWAPLQCWGHCMRSQGPRTYCARPGTLPLCSHGSDLMACWTPDPGWPSRPLGPRSSEKGPPFCPPGPQFPRMLSPSRDPPTAPQSHWAS